MNLDQAIALELSHLELSKTFKKETIIESEQGAVVRVAGKDAVMLASNNYLGLASHPRIKEAAIRGVREFGFGVSSVRFLCGTLTVHRQLEEKIAEFLGMEDTILFSSCFAANEGFFASIVNEKIGLRIGLGDYSQAGGGSALNDRHSFYVGYGRALTGDHWYRDTLRLEYNFWF